MMEALGKMNIGREGKGPSDGATRPIPCAVMAVGKSSAHARDTDLIHRVPLSNYITFCHLFYMNSSHVSYQMP